MSADAHELYAEDIGAYMLGALPEGEAERFERHLEQCPICADELRRLSPAVEAMPRSVVPIQAPPSLKHAIMREVEDELGETSAAVGGRLARPASPRAWLRTLRRGLSVPRVPRLAAGLATAIVLAGIVGFGLGQRSDGSGVRTVAAKVDERQLDSATASLVVPGESGDGHAVLRVHGMPSLEQNRTYELWIRRGDEVIAQSLFRVGEDGDGVAAVRDDLAGADAVMVTREPAEGSRAPTETPVVTAAL